MDPVGDFCSSWKWAKWNLPVAIFATILDPGSLSREFLRCLASLFDCHLDPYLLAEHDGPSPDRQRDGLPWADSVGCSWGVSGEVPDVQVSSPSVREGDGITQPYGY